MPNDDVGEALRGANGGVLPGSVDELKQALQKLYSRSSPGEHNLPLLWSRMPSGKPRCYFSCKVFGDWKKVRCTHDHPCTPHIFILTLSFSCVCIMVRLCVKIRRSGREVYPC